MIAVQPLPGAPLYCGDDEQIIAQALADLQAYTEAGVDALVLENSHDLPYVKPPLDTRAVKLMKRIAREVRKRFKGPIGIQMLEAANETALEIAAGSRPRFPACRRLRLCARRYSTCNLGDQSNSAIGLPRALDARTPFINSVCISRRSLSETGSRSTPL